MAETDSPHLFLVDGSGFIFRAYHALPPMTRSDGTPVNAVFGFTKMLMKLMSDTEADYVAVIFDAARRNFRNEIYAAYKAHRPEAPEDLVPQFPLLRDAVAALNVPCIEMQNYEADDLIATYTRDARERGWQVTIVSSDKDLMQLVGNGVSLFDAMKNIEIGPDQVREKFGVGPDKVIDVQALAGDSSDNVPGVSGIGVKTAAQLIEEYGNLENLLAHAEEIKQPKRREKLIAEAENARISKQLVTLKLDVPVEATIDDFRNKGPDDEKLLKFVQENGFRSLVPALEARLGREAGSTEGAGTTSAPIGRNATYALVTDEKTLQGWADRALATGIVAVDTETTSLNPMRAELVGVSLALSPGEACYIPLGHRTAEAGGDLFGDGGGETTETPAQVDKARALAILKPILEHPGVLKVGQNVKYDMQVLARNGVEMAPVDDTMLLSYVLEGGLHGHGMDELSELHLAHTPIKYGEVAGTGKAQVTFDRVAVDDALVYAAEDADVTWRLHTLLKPRLVHEHMVSVYERLERPLIHVLQRMERDGIKVDATKLRELSADFEKRMHDLEGEIHKLAGRAFNVGSPKQLGEILFEEMGIQGGKKGKAGAWGTGADVLEGLAAEGHDLPARVLDWRLLSKLKSTYTDALVEEINPGTGRIHTTYSQAVASTGRLSSNDPNLQNIPIRSEEGRKIREAFVADAGCVLLSADYSQIELRLLAHVADIAALKDAFRAGQDIHAMTASEVFGVPVEGMDPMVRRQAKAINFGIIYGISGFGLARQLGIGRGDAQRYIDAYFERFPGIKDYMERTKAQAAEQGFVMTPFGRKCHVRGIKEKNPNMRGMAERAAINAPIQGGAADIIKRAMVKLPDALERSGLAAKMLLQVHDELIFEVPENEVNETRALVTDVMQRAADLTVPLVVDAGTGRTWDEAH